MKSVFVRRLKLALPLALLMTMGCKHRKVAVQETIEEAAPSFASTIHMGDPRAAGQLISGFHQIENRAWRWTMRQFSVVLRVPPGAVQKGAVLTLNLTAPAVVIETEKTITLSATINGTALPPETWSKPGEYVYKREVPRELLAGDSLRVDFALDKAIPPTEKDARELGIVVSKAALELK